MKVKRISLLAVLLFLCCGFSVFAATDEQEPNNARQEANLIRMGTDV